MPGTDHWESSSTFISVNIPLNSIMISCVNIKPLVFKVVNISPLALKLWRDLLIPCHSLIIVWLVSDHWYNTNTHIQSKNELYLERKHDIFSGLSTKLQMSFQFLKCSRYTSIFEAFWAHILFCIVYDKHDTWRACVSVRVKFALSLGVLPSIIVITPSILLWHPLFREMGHDCVGTTILGWVDCTSSNHV